ncbi:lectin-like [Ambystoma mexicanum]|uniref:lectin-like n=1 Tax=Ambystoma mexicanum TaxID=8296 RepID=UPI0037E93AA3
MEPVRWICLLIGAALLQESQGLLFHHVKGHKHHDSSSEESKEEENNSVNDPYRSPFKSEFFCQGPCRDGWISYLGQCHLYVSAKKSWMEGEKYCKNMFKRAHLTSILDDEHNAFLMTLAKSIDKNVGSFWTAASDKKGGNLWINLSGFLGITKCKSLGFLGLGLLGDTNCNIRLPFICMYKPKIYP